MLIEMSPVELNTVLFLMEDRMKKIKRDSPQSMSPSDACELATIEPVYARFKEISAQRKKYLKEVKARGKA